MTVDLDIKNLLNRFFDVFDSWITKFYHLPCIGHDDMVVLFVKIGFFVVGLILTKLMSSHQSAFQK